MVKIRLKRLGRKKKPFYRVVVADIRTPRDGKSIEEIGTYNPLLNPPEIKIDLDKVNEWIKKGAKPTDTVAYLIEQAEKNQAHDYQEQEEQEIHNDEVDKEIQTAQEDINDDQGATSAEELASDMVDEAVNLEPEGE